MGAAFYVRVSKEFLVKGFVLKFAAVLALLSYAPAALFAWDGVRALGAEKARRSVFEERTALDCGHSASDSLVWERNWQDSALLDLAVQKSGLCAELRQAAQNFFYKDQDGSGTRIVSADKILDAKAQWEAAAQAIVQEYLQKNSCAEAAEEFYFVEQKVCNELMNELLYDHNSLKKMSDEEAAFFVADSLADKIESETEMGMQALFDSMDKNAAAADEQSVCPVDLDKENWLEKFELELQKGLQKWEEAEDDFLTARAEWEREAENVYESQSAKWQEAYNALQERKKNWSEKVAAQVQAGEREWQKKFCALNEEIADCMESFQTALALELDQKEKLAQSQALSYEQSRVILETARLGIDNWGARWTQKYRGLYSYWKSENSEFWEKSADEFASLSREELSGAIKAWKRDYTDSLKSVFKKTKERLDAACALCKYKYPLDLTFEKALSDAYDRICACSENSSVKEIEAAREIFLNFKIHIEVDDESYWACVEDSYGIWGAQDELDEWKALFDEFSRRADSYLNAFCAESLLDVELCDSLSCEKAKASYLLDVWEKRVKAAQAVYDYSKNQYSDIESSVKTKENLDAALAAFNGAKSEWQNLCALAYEKNAEVERAKQNYEALCKRAQDAMAALEAAQKDYDDYFDNIDKYALFNNYAEIYELSIALKELNVPDEEFEKMLDGYGARIQKEADEKFLERAAEIRDYIVNGSGEIERNPSLLEGLVLDEDFESAKGRVASVQDESSKTLSIARLEEIQGVLEEASRSEKCEIEGLSELLEDLKAVDFSCAKRLSEKLAPLEGAGGESALDDETKDLVGDLLLTLNSCLENRAAALLLIDGSLEEIEEFFKENDGFQDIYESYKSHSAALRDAGQAAARKKLAAALENSSSANLDDYFEGLDRAADGAGEGVQKILDLYKAALQKQQSNQTREFDLSVRIKNLPLSASCEFDFSDCQTSALKHWLLDGSEREAADDYDQELFEKITGGRDELLSKLEDAVVAAEDPMAKSLEISKGLEERAADIERTRSEYKAALDQASGASPQSGLSVYARLCGELNDFLDLCSARYEKLKEARFNYCLCEEVYFYGQNEYIHDSGSALKKLQDAVEKRDSFKAALAALDAVQRNLPLEELDSCKQSFVQYYKARALSYKYEKQLAAQKERLFLAQAAERQALEKLVSEYAGGTVPAAARDLVVARRLSDGSYSFKLKTLGAGVDPENERLLQTYYSDLDIVESDIYGNEIRYSRARSDAVEFFDSLACKDYSLADLALAAMQVKCLGDEISKAAWFGQNEDPNVNAFYKIGDLPDEIHGADLSGSYRAGRLSAIQAAFARVIALGGEEDIAKYILFSETNFSSALGVSEMARNALSAEALLHPILAAENAGNGWAAGAAANFAAYGVFQVIASVPLVGQWAQPVAAAFLAVATALASVAAKCYEVAGDIKTIQAGCVANISAWIENYKRLYEGVEEARKKRAEEQENLNVLVSGKRTLGGEPLSWDDFSNSIKHALLAGGDGGLVSYFYSIHDSTSSQGSLRDFFEECSKKEKIYDAKTALEKMSLVLRKNFDEKKSGLDALFESKNGDPAFDAAACYKNLLAFYANDLLKALPINIGEKMEDYQAEIFRDAMELRARALVYSANKRLGQKQAFFDGLSQDMNERFLDWDQKIQSVLQNGEEQWRLANERIVAAYSDWQKDWRLDYEAADDEWKDNYRGFLADKEDWIYSQYSGASVGDPLLAWTAKTKGGFAKSDWRSVDSYLDSIFDSEKFDRLCSLAENLAAFAQNDSYVQSLFLLGRADSSLAKKLDSSMKLRLELQGQMEAAAAKLAVQNLERQLEESVDGAFSKIAEQNSRLENWELQMVRSSGYDVDPLIHRSAIVDSSVFSSRRETQWVHRYEYFSPNRPAFNFDLSSYAGSSSHAILKKAEELQNALLSWTKENDGEFKRHVGEAPVFVEKINSRDTRERNVKKYGSGEMGLIMLDYQWNSIRNSEGYAEMSKAIYDQKLFDLGVDGLALPTLRDVASVVCDFVGTCTPFVFVKYIDDTLFAACDLAMGFKSWDEVLNDALRQGITAGASYGLGAAANSIGQSLKASYDILKDGAAGRLFDATQKAAVGYATGAASGLVQSFDFVSGKIDWQAAADSWLNAGALAGVAGSLLGGALNAATLVDANGRDLNLSFFGGDAKALAGINSKVGSLAGAALNGILTGNFSVNLFDINGAGGVLELGVKNGQFFGGYGRGGVDLSYGAVSQLVQDAKAGGKILSFLAGGGQGAAVLSAINILSCFDGEEEKELAAALYDKKMTVAFDDLAADSGAAKDGVFTLNKSLLDDGQAGRASIASILALQNKALKEDAAKALESAVQIAGDAPSSAVSDIEKGMAQIDALAEAAAVSDAIFSELGLDAERDSNSVSVAALVQAYKTANVAGIYALYAEARKKAQKEGLKESGLGKLLEQPYWQNEAKNRGELLGYSKPMDEYNAEAKEKAVERYVAACVDAAKKDKSLDLKLVEKEAREKAQKEIQVGVENEKYGYEPETYSLDIKNYGCALSTAAYIAYSITGDLTTLSEANEILKKNDLFVAGTDSNGVTQKNLIAKGDGYAAAVNAIAGGDYLQKDGQNFSVEADKNKLDNRQEIYDRMKESSQSSADVYFTHLRVNDKHSVLLDSLNLGDGKNYKSSSFTVMDPWQGGKFSPRSWADITRADFYKLTQAGKEVYALTRSSIRSSAS